ncbi:hypothetical protein M427DRAFT_245088 [Gonapodya prolifera JEL478]|uniref:Uncharacterized protein n=1 Tax=Gonapodya prolifera (strain JEL478) TaxID=1344416 RepID=A0A139ALV9_GONPJ|nr:hypothetical protein M427DRAFT_245088 [Gonapodya prolifera JEL478]|eukprot:KXS17750.1 hypothetical protein M427DRAFT_245088 [Gonapodya prolifera JEL478]
MLARRGDIPGNSEGDSVTLSSFHSSKSHIVQSLQATRVKIMDGSMAMLYLFRNVRHYHGCDFEMNSKTFRTPDGRARPHKNVETLSFTWINRINAGGISGLAEVIRSFSTTPPT